MNITPLTWASAPAADQGHVLVDLGQPAAQGADGPLQRGVAVDQRLLMGEVPDAVPQFCRLT